MNVSVKSLTNGIERQLEDMVKRANLVPAYLNRVVYPTYQKAQRERWTAENSGADFAGGAWPSLDPAYASWKKRKYADSPGGGSKMMIRTKRLFDSVVGPSDEHRKIVDNKSLRIATTVPYAIHADAHRTFTQFSPKFYSRIYKDLTAYLAKNVIKAAT